MMHTLNLRNVDYILIKLEEKNLDDFIQKRNFQPGILYQVT